VIINTLISTNTVRDHRVLFGCMRRWIAPPALVAELGQESVGRGRGRWGDLRTYSGRAEWDRRSSTPLAAPRIGGVMRVSAGGALVHGRSMSGPREGYARVPEVGFAADAVNIGLEAGPQVQNLLVMTEARVSAR